MRLTCPNCEAQYEVPDDVIPQDGRDVQCSNCGDTWFQHHPDHTPPEAVEEAGDEGGTWEDEGWDDADPAQDNAAAPDAAEDELDHDPGAPEDDYRDHEDHGEDHTDQDGLPRRELDEGVKEILQEEAEREAQARAAERGTVETQPDLGLAPSEDEATRRSREAQARMARLRGEPEPAEEADAIDPTSRRDLLPDIEEINSSLRSEDGGDSAAMVGDAYPEAVPARRGGGFRRGFMLMLILAVIAVLIYVFAPKIAEMVPALADILSQYVSAVDGLRVWLDGQVSALMQWLDGMSSDASSE